MIVCVCKNINAKKLEEISPNHEKFKELQRNTGIGTKCGSCAKEAKKIFINAKQL